MLHPSSWLTFSPKLLVKALVTFPEDFPSKIDVLFFLEIFRASLVSLVLPLSLKPFSYFQSNFRRGMWSKKQEIRSESNPQHLDIPKLPWDSLVTTCLEASFSGWTMFIHGFKPCPLWYSYVISWDIILWQKHLDKLLTAKAALRIRLSQKENPMISLKKPPHFSGVCWLLATYKLVLWIRGLLFDSIHGCLRNPIQLLSSSLKKKR